MSSSSKENDGVGNYIVYHMHIEGVVKKYMNLICHFVDKHNIAGILFFLSVQYVTSHDISFDNNIGGVVEKTCNLPFFRWPY